MNRTRPESPTGAPERPTRMGVGRTLALGWGLGVATGIAYAAVMVVLQRAFGRIEWVSRDVLWMAPLAHGVIFAVAALILWPWTGSDRGRRTVLGVLTALGVFSLLLPFGQIARWASALIALGSAIQVSRVAARRDGFRRLAAAALPLTLAALAIGLAERGWRAWAERHTLVGLRAAPPGAPNVLLVIWDTVRDADLSLYGFSTPTTPALERWARAGVVFDHVTATAPWTLPSHGSIFTGLYPGEVGADWRTAVPDRVTTLAEFLRGQGYLTAGFAANLLYASFESGLAQGFAHYEDFRPSIRLVFAHAPLAQTVLVQQLAGARSLGALGRAIRRFSLDRGQMPSDQYVPATEITDRFLTWQQGQRGHPFFAFLNYFDAHSLYVAPDSALGRLGLRRDRKGTYDAAIAYLDQELDRLLRTLQERGVLDRTLVIVTSDHGEQFGEHGLHGHGNSLYRWTLEVPLLIRFPGTVPEGVRIAGRVSSRDLAATVVDLAGVGGSAPFPGRSLAGAWRDAGWTPSLAVAELTRGVNVDTALPNAHTGLTSIMDDRDHYIRSGLGAEQLFNLLDDSTEARDLAKTPAGIELIHRLRTRLDSVVVR